MEVDQERYDQLPESIKAAYTLEQWRWMGAAGQRRLLQTETEPEVE